MNPLPRTWRGTIKKPLAAMAELLIKPLLLVDLSCILVDYEMG
jgi:hypothetical protein